MDPRATPSALGLSLPQKFPAPSFLLGFILIQALSSCRAFAWAVWPPASAPQTGPLLPRSSHVSSPTIHHVLPFVSCVCHSLMALHVISLRPWRGGEGTERAGRLSRPARTWWDFARLCPQLGIELDGKLEDVNITHFIAPLILTNVGFLLTKREASSPVHPCAFGRRADCSPVGCRGGG